MIVYRKKNYTTKQKEKQGQQVTFPLPLKVFNPYQPPTFFGACFSTVQCKIIVIVKGKDLRNQLSAAGDDDFERVSLAHVEQDRV